MKVWKDALLYLTFTSEKHLMLPQMSLWSNQIIGPVTLTLTNNEWMCLECILKRGFIESATEMSISDNKIYFKDNICH